MPDTRKLTLASALAAAALILAPTANAVVMTEDCFSPTACTFDDLEGGGSITVNDKLFSDWSFDFDNQFNDIEADFTNIVVSGLDDGGLDPGPGLKYSFNGELTLTENDGESFYGLLLDYAVTVLDGNLRIKDNSLSLPETGFSFAGDGGIIEIFEEIGNEQGDVIGEKEVVADNLFSEFDLSDSATFDPEPSIFVFTGILLSTDQLEDTVVSLDMFEQRFSQMRVNGIPEPATLALFGIGLAGLGFARRRRAA